jgi:hypothetical protein
VLQYYAKWSLQYKLVVIVFPVHQENVPHFYVFVLGLVLGLFPGVAVELLWTLVGGTVQFVEATAILGNGDIHLTGQLGDVIKESSQIDLTWVYHTNCKICRFKQLAPLLFFMRKSM